MEGPRTAMSHMLDRDTVITQDAYGRFSKFHSPTGVAIHYATGDVYVADSSNQRRPTLIIIILEADPNPLLGSEKLTNMGTS